PLRRRCLPRTRPRWDGEDGRLPRGPLGHRRGGKPDRRVRGKRAIILIIAPWSACFGKDNKTLPLSFVSKLKNASNVFTFRDFILLPGRSEVEPRDIALSSSLTKKITLELPFVSSPMDTVTEWRLALEMARLGGAGVIHRNLSIDHQVEQVRKVK